MYLPVRSLRTGAPAETLSRCAKNRSQTSVVVVSVLNQPNELDDSPSRVRRAEASTASTSAWERVNAVQMIRQSVEEI